MPSMKQQEAEPLFHVQDLWNTSMVAQVSAWPYFIKSHELYYEACMSVNVRIEQMQWLVNSPPTTSRISLWDLNEHGYTRFYQKDMEMTRGKCPVVDNQ